jgi:hypothetical protein
MNLYDELRAKLEDFERDSKHAQRAIDAMGTDFKRFEEWRASLCGSLKITEDVQRLIAEGEAAAKRIASEPRLKVASLGQPKRRRRPGF